MNPPVSSAPEADRPRLQRSRPKRRWLRRTLLVASGVLLVTAVTVLHSLSWGAAFGTRPDGARLAQLQRSPAWTGGRFHNGSRALVQPVGNVDEAVKGMLRGGPDRQPATALPMAARAETLRTLAVPPASGLRITWIGHSTLLIEIDGQRLLTDPMFSDRAFPSTLVGPKRFQPPALWLEDLPALDAVLLSHDHYDHLDLASIRALNRRGVKFYAPLGVGAHLEHWGVPAERIVELDWWEEMKLGRLTLAATPAHHFSGRLPMWNNTTLWCSWSILGPKHRLFFSGDSGLAPEFSAIGERYGPFDVAFMDIGAADPAWADIHFGPVNALTAFERVRGRRFFPIHWATFRLARHPWSEPAETLVTEAEKRNIAVLTPFLGEPIEPEGASAVARWWRQLVGTAPLP